MIKLKVNLDFKRTEDQIKKSTNQEIVADYITYAVKSAYKEGLDNQWRRTWARIQRKLDDAVEKKQDKVEFENGEMDFIKRSFKDVKFPIDLAKYVVILEDELDRIKDEEDKK